MRERFFYIFKINYSLIEGASYFFTCKWMGYPESRFICLDCYLIHYALNRRPLRSENRSWFGKFRHAIDQIGRDLYSANAGGGNHKGFKASSQNLR